MIVENKRVTVVLATARRARQGSKECVVCDWARQTDAVFVINIERHVDCFDVMIRTDIAVAVWRRASAELGCSSPFEGQQRGRYVRRRTPKILEQRLGLLQAGNAVPCLSSRLARPVRISH